ncbi:MAG: HmuY family protein [Oleispira sp.]|nr:HmuY family protein [Oleispira sp.]
MAHMSNSPLSIAVLASAMALTACGGSSSNSSSGDQAPGRGDGGIATATQFTIDASAGGSGAGKDDPKNKFSYFSFTTGAVVALEDSEAETSNAWDIAFKRNKIIVNPNNAKAALVAEQTDFYNADGSPVKATFLAATADSEAAEFIGVTAEGIVDVELKADAAKPALDSTWYNYDFASHVISANTDNHWLIENAENDDVSIFHVTDITTAGRSAASYTVEFFNNTAASGETFVFPASDAGTEFVVDFSDSSEVCFDIALNSNVDCASEIATWDLRFDSSFNIWLNGGIHGTGNASATTNPDTFEKISAITEVEPYSMSKDTMSGTFTDMETTWWGYGIDGGHNLWSNYRVYAVDADSVQYKLRVLSYYAPLDSTVPAAGTSGVVTFEYEQL